MTATTTFLHDFLRDIGTDSFRHSGRTLYAHLCGTESILRAWNTSEDLCHAGLFHSVYSTEKFNKVSLPLSEREQLKGLIGIDAERLVYLFAILKRQDVFAASDSLVSCPTADCNFDLSSRLTNETAVRVHKDELLNLIILHFANLIEQASRPGTGIGFWLSSVADRVNRLSSAGNTIPKVLRDLNVISIDDERRLHSSYLEGVRLILSDEPHLALDLLRSVNEDCPILGEPYLMRAVAELRTASCESAQRLARIGRERLKALGTAWHKSLTLDDWLSLSSLVEGGERQGETSIVLNRLSASDAATRVAFDQRLNGSLDSSEGGGVSDNDQSGRFMSYLLKVHAKRSKRAARWYPGLKRAPWYNPAEFDITAQLERRFAEIKAEALRVTPSLYHEETEEIGRTGNWKVCMFYEQGRRNDTVCQQCPIISTILEENPSVRKSAGLIYLSRMTPQTHVAAHRGGSNMRLRCHLPISIPAGDCAIRVDDMVYHWEEGKCIVFDDTFEHEVWNRTTEDRLVLLIDLWHPDLSQMERDALEATNWLALWQADRISRTWQRNEDERQKEGKLELKNDPAQEQTVQVCSILQSLFDHP